MYLSPETRSSFSQVNKIKLSDHPPHLKPVVHKNVNDVFKKSALRNITHLPKTKNCHAKKALTYKPLQKKPTSDLFFSVKGLFVVRFTFFPSGFFSGRANNIWEGLFLTLDECVTKGGPVTVG